MGTEPNGCVSNPGCGWCGDKNSCIPGTNRGPLAPCLKNTYLYNSPGADWNPLKAGTINIDTKGLIKITAHPDMGLIHSNKPYNY